MRNATGPTLNERPKDVFFTFEGEVRAHKMFFTPVSKP